MQQDFLNETIARLAPRPRAQRDRRLGQDGDPGQDHGDESDDEEDDLDTGVAVGLV